MRWPILIAVTVAGIVALAGIPLLDRTGPVFAKARQHLATGTPTAPECDD